MSRLLNVLMALGALHVAEGGADKSDETGEVDADGQEATALQPQAGDWAVLTTGWKDDNCNAAEAFTDLVSVTFSDVGDSS